MTTYFRMLKVLETLNLPTEYSGRVLNKLIQFTQFHNDKVIKHSKVSEDICSNFRMTSTELRLWYKQNGVEKTESTIRSQQQIISTYFYDIFGSYQYLMDAFTTADEEQLKIIEQKIDIISQDEFTSKDLCFNVTSVMQLVDSDEIYDEKIIEECLDFIYKMSKRKMQNDLNKLNKEALASVLLTLCEPIVSEKKMIISDENGSKEIAKNIVNDNKIQLMLRLKKLYEDEKDENDLAFNFVSMKDINDDIEAWIAKAGPEYIAGAGTDSSMKKAEFITKLLCNQDYFNGFIEKINPFDLDANFEIYRK